MSDDRHETIEDIVREMRALGRIDAKSTDKIPRSLQALGLRTYADRIEAAVEHARAAETAASCGASGEQSVTNRNRLGNDSRIRAALEQIHALLSIGGNPDTAMCIRYEAAYQLAEDALSAQPRNCDKQLPSESVSADDVEQAWIEFKRRIPDVYFDVPGLWRFIAWLFAEAKGETDGSK